MSPVQWKREGKRLAHMTWAGIQIVAAVAFIALAIKCYDQYRLWESPAGQVTQLSGQGTDEADLYLGGTLACLAAVGLLVWGVVYHLRAVSRS